MSGNIRYVKLLCERIKLRKESFSLKEFIWDPCDSGFAIYYLYYICVSVCLSIKSLVSLACKIFKEERRKALKATNDGALTCFVKTSERLNVCIADKLS